MRRGVPIPRALLSTRGAPITCDAGKTSERFLAASVAGTSLATCHLSVFAGRATTMGIDTYSF
jgi:hypothetical protein